MNHEEHVNQLKSEVRYIQEVVHVRGGRKGGGSGLRPRGLAARVGVLCFPRGVPWGVPPGCPAPAMPAPAAAFEPRPNWQRSRTLQFVDLPVQGSSLIKRHKLIQPD